MPPSRRPPDRRRPDRSEDDSGADADTDRRPDADGNPGTAARRQRELERENARLAELLDVLDHDLRNHLAVAKGRLELARRDGGDEDLEAVARSHERMEELLEDLVSARDEGFAVCETAPVGLSTRAGEAWRDVETGGATLVVESDADLLADAQRFTQLLENLFRNAVEHGTGGDGSDLTVTVGALGDRQGFYVEDDGRGLPTTDPDRLFEGGFSTSADGTGLGLAIVRDVVRGHGWSVDVAEGADGGARFEFTGIERPSPLTAGQRRG